MRSTVPLYCRCTPTDLHPFLRKPVSSITNTALGVASVSQTYFRNASRTPTSPDPTNVAWHTGCLLPTLPPLAIRFFAPPGSSILGDKRALVDEMLVARKRV